MAANNKEGANDFVEIDISGTKAAAETNIDAASITEELKVQLKAEREEMKALGSVSFYFDSRNSWPENSAEILIKS
jgi:hypothetical protein